MVLTKQYTLNKLIVVNQQVATPTSPVHSTEARVDAAAAINNDADQLDSIPRRLQEPCKSWLQCWVIVNSTTGKHGYREPCSHSSLCTNLTNLCFFLFLSFIYLTSALRPPGFPLAPTFLVHSSVIPPAAPLDLSIPPDLSNLLELLGLLCVAVLLFSPDPQSRSTKGIILIGSALVLTVCFVTNCKY